VSQSFAAFPGLLAIPRRKQEKEIYVYDSERFTDDDRDCIQDFQIDE